MSFAGDIGKFASKVTSQIEVAQVEQKERITQFLQELLGDESSTITRIKFDNETLKFYDIEAPESVVRKIREAGHIHE